MSAHGLLGRLTGQDGAPCALECVSVEARGDVPPGWFERYAFAIVRRGLMLRQRLDPDGGRTAVDITSPGAFVPMRSNRQDGLVGGYASTRLLLCVHPEPQLPESVGVDTLKDLLLLMQRTLERVERIAAARGQSTATGKVRALLGLLEGGLACAAGATRRELPLTQRDIAELLHMRHETVCRALRTIELEDA